VYFVYNFFNNNNNNVLSCTTILTYILSLCIRRNIYVVSKTAYETQRRSNGVGRVNKVQRALKCRGRRVPDKINCMTVVNFMFNVQ